MADHLDVSTNATETASDASSEVGSTTTRVTDVTEEDMKHDNIPSDYKHKERTMHGKSPSPSPGISTLGRLQEESCHVSLLRVMDSAPLILQGNHKQPGSAVVDKIFDEIYFSGNWNGGHYVLNSDDEEYDEYEHQQTQVTKMQHPFAVFGDDDLFTLMPNQTMKNREQGTFYGSLSFTMTPYPLPSQRLKRIVYPLKRLVAEGLPSDGAEKIRGAESEYFARIKRRGARLSALYTEETVFETNRRSKDVLKQKKMFWARHQYKLNEQNVGVVSQHNIPPWISKGWYGDCALARNRNLRMPQHKMKTFDSFYPRTARWDRIIRGCYELDWGDEDVILDIVKYDKEKLYKQQVTPFHVILSLRRARLFADDLDFAAWSAFNPFAKDPFMHLYQFYGVTDVTLSSNNASTNIYCRMRDLYWTVSLMWSIGSRFEPRGCLRVPAMVAPIEWTYAVALKLIWDGVRVCGMIGKLDACSSKHCDTDAAHALKQQVIFMKKVTYAFDFNLAQIYDFRYILYLLRHNLYKHMSHIFAAHLESFQSKIFNKWRTNKEKQKEYRAVLDYMKLLVTANNMYQFFSPAQMGKLYESMTATCEELRMVYPQISLNTIEDEYCDMMETRRHASVTKTMTSKSYGYYFGENYYSNREKNIWSDARGVCKQYCIRNTLCAIPNIFELNKAHTLFNEEHSLEDYITDIVLQSTSCPTAFFLTEIKYPFFVNLMRACCQYQFNDLARLLVNHCISNKTRSVKPSQSSKASQLFASSKGYPLLDQSQQQTLDTFFDWPAILFVEYLSFNPRQFHREHARHLLDTADKYKRDLLKLQANAMTDRIKRKILSMTNQIKLQKQKYDTWGAATSRINNMHYPLAALVRFATCERSNSKRDPRDDELIQDGNDFTIAKCCISALKSIFKYPQFASRILINTPHLNHLMVNMAYSEFKLTYTELFKYSSENQERPEMYEILKEKWMTYAQLMKTLLSVYHHPHHRLHRELVWLGFAQYHMQCYDTDNEEDQLKLFDYHAVTHCQAMEDKYKMSAAQQLQDALNDLQQIFDQFGYAKDEEHRFYGNWYREFGVEKDDDDQSGSEDESYEESDEEESDESITDEEEESYEESHEEVEEEAKQPLADIEEEEDDTNNPWEDPLADSTEEEEDGSYEDDIQDEAPKHRRQNTETQERQQFAQEFNIEDVEDDDNPFGHRYDNSSDEQEEEKQALKVNEPEDLDDFDDMDDDMDMPDETAGKESKTRGSNEYGAEDIKRIQSTEDAGSPLLGNIKEDDAALHDADDGNNPWGSPKEEEEVSEEEEPMDDTNAETKQQQEQSNAEDTEKTQPRPPPPPPPQDEEEEEDQGLGGAAGGDDGKKDDGDEKKKKKEEVAPPPQEEDEKEEEKEETLITPGTPLVTPDENTGPVKITIGNTTRHLKTRKRHGMLVGDDDDDDDKEDDSEEDMEDEDDDLGVEHDRRNVSEILKKLERSGIAGMQNRDAILVRQQEQEKLYKRHQVIGRREDEEENIYSLLDFENTEFIDEMLFMNDEKKLNKQMCLSNVDALVGDVSIKDDYDAEEEEEEDRLVAMDDFDEAIGHFDDNKFFEIRASRWGATGKKRDPIDAISPKEAENSYVMLRDLTEPLHLSELLGDFQKAGQIMLSRIDDMQASLIVENKLHCGVLKAHQMDEKNLYMEREELLNANEKLESELKLLRDKRDENKSETAALKTKQESFILKYNELKEISTQKLRDQLRCFEIYKAQTKQLESRISDASYQTEIGYKRLNRLISFKKQQQLNISQLDLEIESMEKEKFHQTRQLENLEAEQAMIDQNEAQYVARLKEQLRRLGKGMENKDKSCNIYRRNVVEERLRIHAIDDSLKKLRTNANPTTESDQELINATQHEALQAREKYAERTQKHSFLTNIAENERQLISCIEKVQNMDDAIYAKKWNIIQKSWNLKKELLATGKLLQMKKYLLKKEKSQKRHKKMKSAALFKKQTQKNLSRGAQDLMKTHSRDFGNDTLPL
eukprot:1111679_1